MKGEFDIKIKRNGRYLNHSFNNRILRSGLDFQQKYSVDNTEDCIITHLLIGTVHSEITSATTGMDIPPVAAVRYVDYIKPEFDDTSASMFKNTLVFTYEPTETVVIKQLGTGRKNVSVIGGIESVSYDYFSLANVKNGNDLGEIVLYRGDSLTVTYTLTVNTATESTSTFNRNEVIWSVLRSNRNWQLCGNARRLKIAKDTLNDYWELQLTPWYYDTTTGTNNSSTLAGYWRIMWQLPDGMTREEAQANAKLKRTMDVNNALPQWNDLSAGSTPSIYSINGKLHLEGASSTFWQSLPITQLDKYYLLEKHNGDMAYVDSVDTHVIWDKIDSKIAIRAKGSPFAIVIVSLGSTVIQGLTDIGYGKGNMMFSDKRGEFKMALTPAQYRDLDRSKNLTITYLTQSGWSASAPYQLPDYINRPYANATRLQYKEANKFNFILNLHVLEPTYASTSGSTRTAIVGTYLVKEGKDYKTEAVYSLPEKNIGVGSWSTYDNIVEATITVPDGVDYLDGTWKFVITLTGSAVLYELALKESITNTPNQWFIAAAGNPVIEAPHTDKNGVSEKLFTSVTISKRG